MNFEKYTKNSMEALQSAIQLAADNQNGQVDQLHLLYALLKQEGGLTAQLMKKLKVTPNRMIAACERELQRIPKVMGAGVSRDNLRFSTYMYEALDEAERQAEYMKDEYVSVEHMLLGLLEKPNGPVRNIFTEFGVTMDNFLEVLQKTRGNTRVTSQNPEDTYDALLKYGVDLTAKARSENPAWARRPSPRAWPSASWPRTCPSACATASLYRWTWARSSPARSTGASLKSG